MFNIEFITIAPIGATTASKIVTFNTILMGTAAAKIRPGYASKLKCFNQFSIFLRVIRKLNVKSSKCQGGVVRN